MVVGAKWEMRKTAIFALQNVAERERATRRKRGKKRGWEGLMMVHDGWPMMCMIVMLMHLIHLPRFPHSRICSF